MSSRSRLYGRLQNLPFELHRINNEHTQWKCKVLWWPPNCYLQIVMHCVYWSHDAPHIRQELTWIALNAPKNKSSLSSWRNSSGGKRTLSPQGTFLKHSLKRAFAMSTFWSDNSLTLIPLFSMGTKANPGRYRPSVICVAWRNSGKVQEKGGGIVAASCWHAYWPIVAVIFFKLSHHNYFANILFPSWIRYSIYWTTRTASMCKSFCIIAYYHISLTICFHWTY